MTLETVAFSVFTFAIAVTLGYVFVLLRMISVQRASLKQADNDLQGVIDTLQLSLDKQAQMETENSDGFLKFLSESREWAFTFIEDMQKDLSTLFSNMDQGSYNADDLVRLKKYLPEEKNIEK